MQCAAAAARPLAAAPAPKRPSSRPAARLPARAAAANASETAEEEVKPLRVSMVRCVGGHRRRRRRRRGCLALLPSTPPPTPRRVCSLGCPKNTVDGEVLLGDLFRSGFEITDAQEEVRPTSLVPGLRCRRAGAASASAGAAACLAATGWAAWALAQPPRHCCCGAGRCHCHQHVRVCGGCQGRVN